MTTLAQTIDTFQSKRKFPNWKPQRAKSTYKLTGSDKEKVVINCLSFVDLEIQVRDWVQSQDNIDEDVRAHLLRNSEDESKHDIVLRFLADYIGHRVLDNGATELISRWQSLSVSPIVAAYALEMGVFFSILPALAKYGDVYCSTVSIWINDDERVHVETNLAVMKHLGLKLTKEVVQLVYDTVDYIFSPLGATKADEEAKRAVRRLTTGKDKQMLQESLPVTTAYFEQDDKRAIVY